MTPAELTTGVTARTYHRRLHLGCPEAPPGYEAYLQPQRCPQCHGRTHYLSLAAPHVCRVCNFPHEARQLAAADRAERVFRAIRRQAADAIRGYLADHGPATLREIYQATALYPPTLAAALFRRPFHRDQSGRWSYRP